MAASQVTVAASGADGDDPSITYYLLNWNGNGSRVHADEAYMDKNNRFRLNDAGLLVYSHGEYLAGGRKVGTFGYSVKKKQQKKQMQKSENFFIIGLGY